MALTARQRKIIKDGLADGSVGDEIADAIDAQGVAVADIGATTDLVGVDGTGSNAAPLVETEGRIDVVEAKVDELLGSLRAAGIIA